MDNTLIINTNKKRIKLLKKQIEKLNELKIGRITKEEVKEIKKGAHRLIAKLWFTPVSIILLLTGLFSKSLLLEGILFSIMYLIALIPISIITNYIVDFMYEKELNEALELENAILEKQKEINKLIKYNKKLNSNVTIKQKDNEMIIEETVQKEKIYKYTKKNKISSR